MAWFLVFYVAYSTGGDPGIVMGYQAPTRMVQVEMPSQETCEQIAKMNLYMSAECWAKPQGSKK